VKEKLPGGASNNFDELDDQGLINHSKKNGGLWMEDGQYLKPCWDKPVLGKVKFINLVL
jgi:hypothetical protein